MVPNEFLEELRGTWGPPAKDPEHRAIWEESMKLLSQVPELLAEAIQRDGTSFDSLITDLGSVEILAELEVDCVEQYLCRRDTETLQEVIYELIELPPWSGKFEGCSSVKKSRFRQRLGEEIANKLLFLIITNHRLKEWFFP